MFKSQCMSLYGCQLWNLKDLMLDDLSRVWRKCARYVIGLHPMTRSYLIPHILNSFSVLDIVIDRQINFYNNVYNHSSSYISSFIKNSLMCNSSYVVSNINKFVNNFNITYAEVFSSSKRRVKNVISQLYENEDWKINMIIELLEVKDGIHELDLEKDIVDEILINLCTERWCNSMLLGVPVSVFMFFMF